MKNQEFHKNLRHNKTAIKLAEVEEPPPDYVRPNGFNMVETVMHYRSGDQPEMDQTVKYYKDLKEEMSR